MKRLLALILLSLPALAQNRVAGQTGFEAGVNAAADTGTANAYVVTTANSGIVGFEKPFNLCFLPAHSNTGASTITIGSASAVTIQKNGGTALSGGEIVVNQPACGMYDGTYFQLNGGGGSGSGSGYSATSSTSLPIGTGSTTFTTQSGLAYSAGSLSYAAVCSSGTPTACFFGNITSYSGTSLVLNVTSTSGSGTHSDWLITVSGATGATGPTGPTGATGPIGPSGLQSGTVTVKTGSYTSTSSDAGVMFEFTGASSTYTLPSSIPAMPWLVGAYSDSATGLTVSGNGNSILYNGSLVSSFTLADGLGANCLSNTGASIYLCVSSSGSGGTSSGGVNVQTSNYTATSSDQGKTDVMNGTGLTWTAPATPPSSVWFAWVLNINSSALTTSSNSLLVNGAAGSGLPQLQQSQAELWYTDGTNYYVVVPAQAGSGFTVSCTAAGGCSFAVNSAIFASVTNTQEGNYTTVFSTNGTSSYTGSPANGCGAGTVLTNGMDIDLTVDVTNSSGAASLNYCSTSAISIKNPDGVTDPFIDILPVGRAIPLHYNGTVFLLPAWMAYSTVPETFVAGTGGVTINTIVITDTSNPAKVIAGTGTSDYGIALATAVAGATVQVQRYGKAYCVADNAVTAGDLIIPGTSTVIDCRDSGQTSSSGIPITTRIVGMALTSASSGSTFVIELTPHHYGTQLEAPMVTLTDGTTVTWAVSSAIFQTAQLTFTATGGSRTLNITGLVNPGQYVVRLVQGSSGSEGLTLGTGCTWKVAGGGSGAVTLSTAANAVDVLGFFYDGTNCNAVLQKNFD